MKVKVLDIPIRYGHNTYRMGEVFEIEEEYFRGIEELVVPQASEESQEPEAFPLEQIEEKSLDKMTVAELKEYAIQHEIDLGEATKKDDILAVIKGAESDE
ncbi:hypothetical protein [Brevibacillus laterosporus]|uniref:Rho termination factor N-terminal domain-containing protein n=1 Tax=Brevibacillus laterosporus TaxID=1465 RepID=A0AAP3DL93_BRELA|nr:hypothetical protein [Brevibacillus laterosporus]MCR8983270.1 hypothetical protein [Brevibacillus laterosporus]MCZ0810426.1 hypothetical protein [Brevibacillus laterosporus]MCZ0829001.1 hypothetical protein [Brevibacillus laterosporus]MCZ0853052.1 hypothetical protein [Brevibacillus laterosporus]